MYWNGFSHPRGKPKSTFGVREHPSFGRTWAGVASVGLLGWVCEHLLWYIWYLRCVLWFLAHHGFGTQVTKPAALAKNQKQHEVVSEKDGWAMAMNSPSLSSDLHLLLKPLWVLLLGGSGAVILILHYSKEKGCSGEDTRLGLLNPALEWRPFLFSMPEGNHPR